MGNGQSSILTNAPPSASPPVEPDAPTQRPGLAAAFSRNLPRATWAAANTALLYLALSVFWIIFSDRLLLLVADTSDVQHLTRLQTIKGWAFVFLSAACLFLLVRRFAASIERAQRAAEASNRTKDQFLAVLSHELRTPLTPALLNASALRCDTRLPQDARETASEIADQITAEARIIDDLLDVSGIATGAVRIDRHPVDMHALIHQVISALQPDMRAKPLTLTLHLDAAECVVSGDRGRLQQVLRAVIGNAAKFTPADGQVTVSTSMRNRQLLIEVTDTGVGITSELMSRLFRPFEQGDRTISRQFGGLGLGLSLCRQLLTLHGGTISAASEGSAKGAQFQIHLPLMRTSDTTPQRTGKGSSRTGPPLRILLVEDDTETRGAMAAVLRGMGHTVAATGSVIDAERIIHNNGPLEILITDIDLPDGDGRELLNPARLRHGATGITISGFGGADDVARSLAAGFNCHLVKPVTPEQIRLAIQHCAQLLQRA